MEVITVRNVQQALPIALELLDRKGRQSPSRNGPVMRMPVPVTTQYTHPKERVIFWPLRDANPFFHLFESLWMLAGRNDLAFPMKYAKNIASYSDDGETIHGAYGHRWREHFGRDQIEAVINLLQQDPNTRRAVICMWDPDADGGIKLFQGKDVPCNLVVHFRRTGPALDMTVFCRSNDIVWGCYGANAVHFSILQEYVASALDAEVGFYWQISDDWHGYLNTIEPLKSIAEAAPSPYSTVTHDPYVLGTVTTMNLMNTPLDVWDMDLKLFFADQNAYGFNDPFFSRIAKPMFFAHQAYKARKYEDALKLLEQMPAGNDWRQACIEWVLRRNKKARAIADGGSQYDPVV